MARSHFLHILTVGTTAWEGWRKRRLLIDGYNCAVDERKHDLAALPGRPSWWCQLRKLIEEALSGATACDIRGRRRDREEDPYPAEVSSLVLWADENLREEGNRADLLLLCSPTEEGRFSAYMLQDVLRSLPGCGSRLADICVKEVVGLDPRCPDRFSSEGLPNLGDLLWKAVVEGRQQGKRPIVNLTGGYKGQIPFLTVAAMCLEEVDFIYLFQDSPSIIKIPPMPIALDLVTWRDRRAILSHWARAGIPESVVESLESPLRQALRRDATTGRYHHNEIGRFIETLYRDRREALTPHGAGKQLVERIGDVELRAGMSECVARWQGIWQGDRIPETVEHGRGHTQRVQELALQLLLGAKLELSDQELALLIAAIWLHDIGHSGSVLHRNGKKYLVGDFPSLVRQFHHLLSRQAIEAEHESLFWDGVPEWLWQGAALLAAYHRGQMPLGPPGYEGAYCKQIVEVTTPLSKEAEGPCFKGIRLHALGALLRVLDALDCQAERGLSPADKTGRHLASTREVQAEIVRLNLLPREDAWTAPDAVGQAMEVASGFRKLECDESESDQRDRAHSGLEKHILQRLKNGMTPDSSEWALLSCLDRIAFKLAQPAHYKKHATVAAAFLAPPEEASQGGPHITAWFVGRPGASEQEIAGSIDFPGEWEKSGAVIECAPAATADTPTGGFGLTITHCCKASPCPSL